MFSLANQLPASQRTTAQVRITLNLTLMLFTVAMILQLPALYFFAQPYTIQGLNWLCHLLALLAVWLCQHFLHLNVLKLTLFSLYYSYLTWVLLLWPELSNTYYYFLLAMVIAGFVFTRSERFTQTLVLSSALLLFGLFSVLHYQPQLRYGLLQLTNDLTLGALSLGIYRILRHQTISRWQGLRGAHQTSLNTLNQLLPNDPESPAGYWQPGKTRQYQCACVLFADLHGYTRLNRQFGDRLTVHALNNLYSQIDTLTDQYPVEKIKTNGDQYIAVSGLSNNVNGQYCQDMYQFACALHRLISRYSKARKLGCSVRIGIATGPVTAGIIGKNKPYFDIWGKTVNLAAYLEHKADSRLVSVCPNTATTLSQHLKTTKKTLSSAKHPDIHYYYQVNVTTGLK